MNAKDIEKRGLNVCPFCKNKDTQSERDMARLKELKDHHGQPFFAYNCFACGGSWHFTEKNVTL